MITHNDVRQAIDEAESAFGRCWAILDKLRHHDAKRVTSKSDIMEFQPRLAQTIYSLSALYRRIEQEKKHRISSKSTTNASWFRARMRLLAHHQKAINHAIEIGRTIGDGFAWLFYASDRRYLRRHLDEPRSSHAPPGIGGLGEVAFIREQQVVGKHLMIYHGITNMLRLGDVSIVDLETSRIAGIGEVKSRSIDDERLEVSVILSGPAERLSFPSSSRKKRASQLPVEQLPAKARDRLRRQVTRIGDSFQDLGKKAEKDLLTEASANFASLERVVKNSGTRRLEFVQAGRSMVLAALRLRRASLYTRLTKTPSLTDDAVAAGVEEAVKGIMNDGANDNALHASFLIFDENGQIEHQPGMMHPMWWPVKFSILRDLIFRDVIVIALWNPSHLRQDLEEAGFTIAGNNPHQWRVSKLVDGRVMEMGGMSYFITMVQRYLQSDESILALFENLETTLPRDVKNARIDLYVNQDVRIPRRG